jgi:pimeloyl-ACP methyl ester carboxylesterase
MRALRLGAVALLALSTTAWAQGPDRQALLESLQRGGHVIVMRHATAPREPPTEATAVAGNRTRERQLDEAGRRSAAAMGIALRARRIPIATVLSSPTFRALETARYAQLPTPRTEEQLGDAGQSMKGATEGQAAYLRNIVRAAPRGGNLVAITHQQNITAAFPNIKPPLAEGEAIIFRPGGPDGATLVGRLAVDAWGPAAPAPQRVSLPTADGGSLQADLYGAGARAVVLAHGGRFNKESWIPQARALEAAGFRVLAIDLRGTGQSTGPGLKDPHGPPLHEDVLAAVRYLRSSGAKTVSVVGGSMGGGATADALARARPGEIDRVVLLAASGDAPPEKLTGRKLFILCRDDIQGENTPRLPEIRAYYDRTPQPRKLVVLECSAHAQFIFQTDQAERLMREILGFLTAP